MTQPNTSRRQFLFASLTAMAVTAAGCLGTTTEFEYPEGFSEEGIDVPAAFGYGSAMDELDSVHLETHLSFSTPEEEWELISSGEIDRTENQYYQTVSETFRIEDIDEVEQFFDGTTVYERVHYTDGTVEFAHHESVQLFREFVQLEDVYALSEEVAFDLVEINEDHEPQLAAYSADRDGMDANPRIQDQTENAGPFQQGSMILNVDEKGLLHLFDTTMEFENLTQTFEFTYSQFNEATVSEPEWVDDAREQV